MKSTKIIYWVTTIIIVLMAGVASALTFNDANAIAMFKKMGYPEYFRIMLSIFKIVGSIVLIVPTFKGKVREWAYAGFGIDFIAAAVAIWATAGKFTPDVLFPVAFMGILTASYISNQKLQSKL
jgi:hypothetical protein